MVSRAPVLSTIGNTQLVVGGLILKYEADAAGFASPDKYRQYRDAQETVRAGQQVIEKGTAALEQHQAKKQQLAPIMAAARAELAKGKAVMAPNQYLEMTPLTLTRAHKTKVGAFQVGAISFKAQVKNITSETLKEVGFEANIYLKNIDKPFIAQAVTRNENLNGIGPGESREVTFTLMGVAEAKDAYLMFNDAWIKADSFSVLVLPSAYTDAGGQRYSVTGWLGSEGTSRFGRSSTRTITKLGEQTLWSWYEGFDNRVHSRSSQVEAAQKEVAAAQALIQELERTKASL